MKKILAIAIVLVALIALAVFLEPTQTALGVLNGEQFFESRPTRYWASALQSDDPDFSTEAKEKLQSGGAKAAAILDEILRTRTGNDPESTELRLIAAGMLGEIGADAKPYSDTLLGALDDSDPHVRNIAARSLPKVDTPAEVAVPALIKSLDGPARIEATRAISQYGKDADDALEVMIEILLDKNLPTEERWNAARTLGKMREAGAPAIDVLVQSLKDEAPTVREHSAEALGDIGPPAHETVPALLETLADPVPRVRRDAARSLGQIGVKDPAVIEALQKLAKDDPEAEVQEFAANALKELEQK